MKNIFKNQFRKILLFTVCSLSLLVVSCSGDDDGPGEPPVGNAPPIELDCDLFLQDLTLVDDPDAPVDYVINCSAAVKGKLTIEPGVVIHFGKDTRLRFKDPSSIYAVGTADKHIVMTGSELNPGWWGGLLFETADNTNIMEFVDISYSGGQTFNGNGPATLLIHSNGAVTMNNCSIKYSEETAFEAPGNTAALNLENNVFSENGKPVMVNYFNAHKLSATNDYSGNDLDRVILLGDSGSLQKEVVWQNINVPYRATGGLGIAEGGVVTIEPGVIMEMAPNSGIKSIDGGLKIVGTQALPITIRGQFSGSGSWKGIFLNTTHPINEIGFTKISDAGENPEADEGAVELWYNSKLYIHDVAFKDLGACAVYGWLHPGQSENPNYTASNLSFENVACEVNFEQ